MPLSADRLSGLVLLLLGVLLYLWVIPIQIEPSEGSWLNPDSIPNVMALILATSGALLLIKPTGHKAQNIRSLVLVGTYVCVLAGGLFAISQLGFLYAAPGIALAVMLLTGERRPLWLLLGVGVMPMAIWYIVVHVLERSIS